MSKTTLRSFTLSLLLITISLVGCERNGGNGIFARDDGEIDFGVDYDFATAERETEADEPPVITNDSLKVWVRYEGGCEDHDFRLGHRISGDTADVWIHHDDRGDTCEERFVERLSFRLPDAVLNREHVRLLDPSDDSSPLLVQRIH